MKNVVFSTHVEKDLLLLVDILIDEGYISTYPIAVKYVDDLIDYILEHIEIALCKPVPAFFNKYGNNMKYMMYQRSNHITWYIMFEEFEECFFVKYITNNKYEGQYFNVE